MEQKQQGYFSIIPVGNGCITRFSRELPKVCSPKDTVFVDTTSEAEVSTCTLDLDGGPAYIKASLVANNINLFVSTPISGGKYNLNLKYAAKDSEVYRYTELRDVVFFERSQEVVVLANVYSIQGSGECKDHYSVLIGVKPEEFQERPWVIQIQNVIVDTICLNSKEDILFVAGIIAGTEPVVYAVNTSLCAVGSHNVISGGGDDKVATLLPMEFIADGGSEIQDIIYDNETNKLAAVVTVDVCTDDGISRQVAISAYDQDTSSSASTISNKEDLEGLGIGAVEPYRLHIRDGHILVLSNGNGQIARILDFHDM